MWKEKMTEKNKPDINLLLVTKLISKQFPEWANLPITKVEPGGHDNRTYRLGGTMLIRLPSAESYALKVEIEHKYLPILAKGLWWTDFRIT